MKIKILFLLFFISKIIFAQWETPRQFSNTQSNNAYSLSTLLKTSNEKLIYFWIEDEYYKKEYSNFIDDGFINYAISTNNGINWGETQILKDSVRGSIDNLSLTAIVTNTGRILITYSNNYREKEIQYSDDSGINWSEPILLDDGSAFYIERYAKFCKTIEAMWIVQQGGKHLNPYTVVVNKSTDNGTTWSNQKTLFPVTLESYPQLFSSAKGLIAVYKQDNVSGSNVLTRSSSDDGDTWSDSFAILETNSKILDMTSTQKSNGDMFIYYQKESTTPFDSLYQTDIFYIYSYDGGATWSNEFRYTNFINNDGFPEVTEWNNEIYLSFTSDRNDSFEYEKLWFTAPEIAADTNCPPYIYSLSHNKGSDSLSISITAMVDDDVQLDSVILDYTVNGTLDFSTAMFDDGLHNDQEANDKIYGVKLSNFNYFDELEYTVTAFDNQMNKFSRTTTPILFNLSPPSYIDVVDVNNIWLPFDHEGGVADANPGIGPGGKYDDIRFFYSGGFYISGYSNSELWTAASHSSTRIQDFQAGTVGADPNFEKHKIYTVRSSDIPFSESWQDWQLAVSMGAKFYDGNNDGIYAPVDLNFNGIWDYNEDRPDFQGDITAWCVYNDGIPKEWRRYWSDQQGIEIKQSLFASAGEGTHYEDIIFIRYEIENTGLIADEFDSVYFSMAIDPDLGDHVDDLIGCDTLDNRTYTYNPGPDQDYGVNPPAFFVKQLQGPPVFIPGETFIDNNSDDEFTLGVDTPLDSAVFRRGKYLGNEFIEGAKNLSFSSLMQIMSSHPTISHPNNEIEARNYLVGGSLKSGEPLDPCTWEFGNGASLLNCHFINPKFMYSGDPVSNDGWINTTPIDQTYYMSTGPFKIKAGEPIELIYAYIVGRGTDHLNSVTVAREISQFAQAIYDNNFEDLPTGIDDYKNLIANDFKLYQNYPNPFNPVTTIKFTMPGVETRHASSLQNVVLKIFDILGREITTLVNEQKPAGTYEVQLDASTLSSGVYFYQLKYDAFIQTKKLVLLK
jgi:type IX secretion system substrate protein/BNR repeat protein